MKKGHHLKYDLLYPFKWKSLLETNRLKYVRILVNDTILVELGSCEYIEWINQL